MSVPKVPFPLAKIPAALPPVPEPPPEPEASPSPSGPPAWLEGKSPDEYLYQQAVRRAFAPKPPAPSPEGEDPHSWVWR